MINLVIFDISGDQKRFHFSLIEFDDFWNLFDSEEEIEIVNMYAESRTESGTVGYLEKDFPETCR